LSSVWTDGNQSVQGKRHVNDKLVTAKEMNKKK
jgi:hypothetical protein